MRMVRCWLATTLIISGLCWAQSPPEPLGDVARKNPAPARKAKRIITDDDMPQRAPVAEPDSASASASAPGAAPADEAQKKDPAAKPPDAQQQAVLNRIEELKTAESVEKRIIERLEKSLAEETSDFRKRMFSESLENARQQLKTFSSERAELEQKVAAGQAKPTASAPAPAGK